MITIELLDISIKLLKNNKACGIASIIHAHIKYAYHIFKNIYLNLSNIILHTVIILDDWSVGIINQVYKKGDECDASNYRPIILLSCLSKFFIMILNERLFKYVKIIYLYISYWVATRLVLERDILQWTIY